MSRKKLETLDLYLPDGSIISVIVTEITNNRVRLGIVANEDVRVVRRELNERRDAA